MIGEVWKQGRKDIRDVISQPTLTGTYYSTPSGVTAYKTSSYNSTEANSKLRMMKAFTVNNLLQLVEVRHTV